MEQHKIQLLFEAINKTESTFTELKNSLKDISQGHDQINKQSDPIFKKLKASWLEIAAAAYAVAKTVRTAWDYMEIGARAQQAEESFHQVAESMGEDANRILEGMKHVADGTVDDSDIMQKAVKGMMQGLSGDQLINIMAAARTAARVAGEDVKTAYEGITDAIANKMPRGLIKYGLITKEQTKMLNEAMALGITEVDIYGLAMENAANQMAKLTVEQQNNIEKMQRWSAMFNEIRESISKSLFWLMDNVIEPLVKGIEKTGAGFGAMVMKAAAVWNWITSGFKGGITAIQEEFIKLDKLLIEQEMEIDRKHANKPIAAPKGGGKTSKDKENELKNILAMRAKEAEIQRQITQLDTAELDRSISHEEAARRRLELEEQFLAVQQKNLELINDPNARATKEKEIDDTLRKIAQLKIAYRELSGTFSEGVEEGFKRYLESARTAFQNGVALAQQTAQAMESAFSDFFFDVMIGKLKSLWEYIKSFLQAVARAVANMLAQQMVIGLFGSKSTIPINEDILNYNLNTDLGMGTGYAHHSGGLVMHEGGYVPRFHMGGLSSDERAAILQTGEYVVSRKGVAALDRLNSGNAGQPDVNVAVNVSNESGVPMTAQAGGTQFNGDRYVVNVILKALDTNPTLRNAVAGAR